MLNKLRAALSDAVTAIFGPKISDPMDTSWQQHEFYQERKNAKLVALAAQRGKLMAAIAKAKAQKKSRKHIYAALEANTAERLRVEAGQWRAL